MHKASSWFEKHQKATFHSSYTLHISHRATECTIPSLVFIVLSLTATQEQTSWSTILDQPMKKFPIVKLLFFCWSAAQHAFMHTNSDKVCFCSPKNTAKQTGKCVYFHTQSKQLEQTCIQGFYNRNNFTLFSRINNAQQKYVQYTM